MERFQEIFATQINYQLMPSASTIVGIMMNNCVIRQEEKRLVVVDHIVVLRLVVNGQRI
jgi:hypothetical protein